MRAIGSRKDEYSGVFAESERERERQTKILRRKEGQIGTGTDRGKETGDAGMEEATDQTTKRRLAPQ